MRTCYWIVYWSIGVLRIVNALDPQTCLNDVRSGMYGLQGALDNSGNQVTNVTAASAISYDLCVSACGAAPAAFDWSIFSQRFGAWLLPWLALISQLPFGSEDHLDNLESMILSIGSPVLAAYSLALTALNERWIARRFLPSKHHPNAYLIVRVLSSLQQSPIVIEADRSLLERLVRSSEIRGWWETTLTWLNLTHSWSIAAAASIAWVIIAYIATVVDSLTDEVGADFSSNGQAVGSVWLWLLPIVVGWLQISPKCDSEHLRTALSRARDHALKAEHPAAVGPVTPLTVVHVYDQLRRDESRSPPIFNYARLFSWTQSVEKVADALQTPVLRVSSGPTIDSQETAHEDPITPLDIEDGLHQRSHRWGHGVWKRIIISACFALFLQWGTTAAAVVVTWITPTVGLGCRSISYLVYAGISTVIWMMCLMSSVLSHAALTSTSKYARQIFGLLSIALRRLGKISAALNSLGLVTLCVFQFSSVFQNCFCNSTALWHGVKSAYIVIVHDSRAITHMRAGWIGGEILGATVALAFTLFIRLFMKPSFPSIRSIH